LHFSRVSSLPNRYVSDSESPSTVLWALYFAGQHYDYLQRYDEALRVVEAGITHTPTAIDFYVLKARIYKVILQ